MATPFASTSRGTKTTSAECLITCMRIIRPSWPQWFLYVRNSLLWSNGGRRGKKTAILLPRPFGLYLPITSESVPFPIFMERAVLSTNSGIWSTETYSWKELQTQKSLHAWRSIERFIAHFIKVINITQ